MTNRLDTGTPPELAELLARLAQFDTALVANTVEALRPATGHEWYLSGAIQSVTPELGPTVGVAYTCELDSSSPGGEPAMDDYWRLLEMAEAETLPVVWVVRTVGSRPEHECVLGDGMAKTMRSVGCVGMVTDGGARDLAGISGASFAVYCKGKTIHHGALRGFARRPSRSRSAASRSGTGTSSTPTTAASCVYRRIAWPTCPRRSCA